MNYALDYLIRNNSNYAYMNVNNIYNFVYDILNTCKNEEEREEIMKKIKLQIGMSFYSGYVQYCSKKGL